MNGPRANLTTTQAVMSAHGGELTFWLAWLSEEIKPEVRDWFRAQAACDPTLRQHLESVDHKPAREQLQLALEATNYLTPRTDADEAGFEPMTDIALESDLSDSSAHLKQDEISAVLDWGLAYPSHRRRLAKGRGHRELHRRVSRSLFQLLAEVEVPLPAEEEVRDATVLLHHLAGYSVVDRFRRLDHWLNEARRRACPRADTALDRVLHWLAPELFVLRRDGYSHHLSFRLYLRGRLKDYCRKHGLKPTGPRYYDLDTAFAQLQRARIGQIIYQAIEETADPGLVEAKVAPRQVLQWLQAAP